MLLLSCTAHCLFDCPFAAKIWESLFLWNCTQPMNSISSLFHVGFKLGYGNFLRRGRLLWKGMPYALVSWRERKARIFYGLSSSSQNLLSQAKQLLWSWSAEELAMKGPCLKMLFLSGFLFLFPNPWLILFPVTVLGLWRSFHLPVLFVDFLLIKIFVWPLKRKKKGEERRRLNSSTNTHPSI